jgi:sporulation protein YlmC with PRC-barrel domain
MEIAYGALVVDKNDEALGTINQIILDTWTGNPRKFVVRRKTPETALFFSPEHVTEVTKKKVKLNISVEELEQA